MSLQASVRRLRFQLSFCLLNFFDCLFLVLQPCSYVSNPLWLCFYFLTARFHQHRRALRLIWPETLGSLVCDLQYQWRSLRGTIG